MVTYVTSAFFFGEVFLFFKRMRKLPRLILLAQGFSLLAQWFMRLRGVFRIALSVKRAETCLPQRGPPLLKMKPNTQFLAS